MAYYIKHIIGPMIVAGMALIIDLAKSHYTEAVFAAAFFIQLWLVFLPAKTSISKHLFGVFVKFTSNCFN